MQNQTYFVDLALTVGSSGGTITLQFYVNGSLISTTTATNSGTIKGQPRSMQISFPQKVAGGAINFTEFIVAVDESTINLRLATLDPASAGAESDWSGTVAGLADQDTGSGIFSINAGDRFSSIFTAYGGPSSPAGVRGVFLKALPGSIAGGPTQLDQYVRISAVEYDGTPTPVVTGTPQMREMVVNPATSAPWATGAFAALEAGVRSVA